MKIGYFITQFPYSTSTGEFKNLPNYGFGGAEVVAYHLANNMVMKGHEVYVFTSSRNCKKTVETINGMEIHRYGSTLRYKKGVIPVEMIVDTLRHKLDIVHAHFSTPMAEFAAFRYAHAMHAPLLIHYHGDWVEYGAPLRRNVIAAYNKYLLKKLLSYARRIICPSQYYINESKYLAQYKDKIAVIPNGIDTDGLNINYSKNECREKLGIPPSNSVILFMGHLIPYKTPDILLRMLPALLETVKDVTVVIAGSGLLENELKKMSADLHLERHVIFPGFVTGQTKTMYFKATDVFVLPSSMQTEVFPIVLLEASTAGLPMVVSDLSTFQCIIESGYNGMITKRGDADELVAALKEILTNKDLQISMGKNSLQKVQEFTWARIATLTLALYEELLN